MQIQSNKSLKNYSTFGIGGPALFFTMVSSLEEMSQALIFAKEKKLPFFILGKGSNSLFDDKGFPGLVIYNNINFISEEDGHVKVGAGYSFSLLGIQMARKGYGGLEFASGIPGSVGGAIFMNAGANGGETCETLTHVGFVDEEGKYARIPKEALSFSYRHSSFHKMKGAIVVGEFLLKSKKEAREQQIEIVKYRIKTQPYSEKSCGCVFANPFGNSAGELIERSGLKGKRIGDAEVSSLHANFIINRKNATAQDVLRLADLIEKEVEKKTGIRLKRELRIISYEL